jgi:SAM-dependent methyltransferase
MASWSQAIARRTSMFQPSTRHTPYNPPEEPRRQPRQSGDIRLASDLVRSYYPALSDSEIDPPQTRVIQHIDFLRSAFPDISEVRGKRILDVACGSRNYPDNVGGRYDPWMARLLVQLGAHPVGVDLSPQHNERFEWYQADLLVSNALAFLPSRSLDAYYICAFPTRKCVEAMFTTGPCWSDVRTEILSHLSRALKPEGRVIRTFTTATETYVADTSKPFLPPVPPALSLPPRPLPNHYYDDCFLE